MSLGRDERPDHRHVASHNMRVQPPGREIPVTGCRRSIRQNRPGGMSDPGWNFGTHANNAVKRPRAVATER